MGDGHGDFPESGPTIDASAAAQLSDEGLPTPGTMIGEFRIIKPLGVGGCGAVFSAYQQRLDRSVAVKVLLPSAVERIEGLGQRFLREINLAKRLEHPNIVRLYDFGETETGLIWMAMELVRGPEFAHVLSSEGALSPARAQHIILQTLSALAEAHEMSIVHRDLKPGNIMLTAKGADSDVVKLLDFGVGKALGEHEDSAIQDLTGAHGDSFGTPRYMAPELLMKDEIGPHSDVYAVGLILYEALTGLPAVAGETIYEILARQLSTPLDLPAWLANSPLGPVLMKATAKDGSQRYPTALEFHAALRDIDPALIERYKKMSLADVRIQTNLEEDATITFDNPLYPSHGTAQPPPQFRPSSAPVAGSFVAPSQPISSGYAYQADDEYDLKQMLSTRKAANQRMIIFGGVGVFIVLMVVFWVALSGNEEEPKEKETKVVAPPPETTPPPSEPTSFVTWTFGSQPEGAKVQVNGRQVCAQTPCTADIAQKARQVTVYFTLEGHLSLSKAIIPEADGDVSAVLQPISEPEKPLVPGADAGSKP